MATQKPKIQGYIDQAIFNSFEIYRQDSNLSQSQALEKILSNFFGSSSVAAPYDHDLMPLITSINELRLRVTLLEASNLPSESLDITSNLPSESLDITSNLPSESLDITSNLPSESLDITSNLPSELELSQGLSQRALARRLGCSHSHISKQEKKGVFTEQSKESDPQGLTWELREKKYYPMLDKSNELASVVASELSSESEPFIVVEYDKDIKTYRYWTGSTNGFSSALDLASRYISEETAVNAMNVAASHPENQYFEEEGDRFEISYKPLEFLSSNRLWQLKQIA